MTPPIPYAKLAFPLADVLRAFMARPETLARFTFSDEGMGLVGDAKEHPYADQADDN